MATPIKDAIIAQQAVVLPDNIAQLINPIDSRSAHDFGWNAFTNVIREDLANTPILNSHVSDNAITTSKIADTAITEDKLATSSVGNTKIKANGVQTANVKDLNITKPKLSQAVQDQLDAVGGGSIVNNPDDEDLETVGSDLKFKDRTAGGNQKGYKIIRSDFDFTSIPVGYADSKWIIQYDHDLSTNTAIIPTGVELEFNGGFIKNGTIQGNGTKIKAGLNHVFNSDISITGTWNVESKPEWFGAKFNGVDDDIIYINKALTFSGNVLFQANKTYAISEGLIVNETNHVKGNNTVIKPLNNIAGSIVIVRSGGSFKGFSLLLNVFLFDVGLELQPAIADGRIILSNAYDWAEDITMLGNSAAKAGTAVKFNCEVNGVSDGSIQLVRCSRIKANYFAVGIHLRAVDASWCNSNIFNSCEMSRTIKPIWENPVTGGTVAANVYNDFVYQFDAGDDRLIFHDRSVFKGLIWDGGVIEFTGNNNVIETMSSSLFTIFDYGINNKIKGHRYDYFDKRTAHNEDTRPRLLGFTGKKSFIDEFYGSDFVPPWELASIGISSVNKICDVRGGIIPYIEQGLQLNTGSIIDDSVELSFANNGGFVSELNPVMHFTNRWLHTTAADIHVSLYSDSDNFIGVESINNGTFELVCKSGGIETRQDILLVSDGVTAMTRLWSRFYFFTLRITKDKVTVSVGVEAFNSNNLYQCIFLQEKSGFGYSAEITTNIPVTELLEPRFYVKTLVASSASVSMENFQLYSANGYSDTSVL